MSQTYTAKGTIASKSDTDEVTVPNVSMVGGDSIRVAIVWDVTESANPTSVKFGGKELNFALGHTLNSKWRVRVYTKIIKNTRESDVDVKWPTSTAAAKLVTVSSHHQAGAWDIGQENENLAATISTTGAVDPIDHIATLHVGFHVTNGPSGDNIGTSSTGHTLGQRVGTTGGDADTNVTIQETYKIITASTISAGSFVVDSDYQIKTVGTTDFTAIGAASNTVGVQFTATGVGSGTGDAYHLENTRSRLQSLTNRDHMALGLFFKPKNTYVIKAMYQDHILQGEEPDWVFIGVEEESSGREFRIPLDPDDFDDWSDQTVSDFVAKWAATFDVNIVDSNLVYEADAARDTRMATFVDDQVIL